MADIISDGNTRVYWVPTIANIAAPTTTELNAGTRLDQTMTADGLVGFRPEQQKVPTTPLSGKFTTQRNGRVAFGDQLLRFKKQDGTDTIHNLLVANTEGYVAIRRDLDAGTAWASSQKLSIYPAQCGETAYMDPEENSLSRYEVPITTTSQPQQRATVA